MAVNGREKLDRASGTGSEIVPIKRYPNRRFYDREQSRYVTLQDIETLVREGRTIEVRDSRNDEDLTRVVLTQILLERQPERMEMFPIPLLHIMLRANDLSLEFLRVFMRLSLATLESLQAPRNLSPFVSPFDWMRLFFPAFSPGPAQAPTADPESRRSDEPRSTPIASPEATIERLARRLAELEGRLSQLENESPTANEPRAPQDQQPRQGRGLEDPTAK